MVRRRRLRGKATTARSGFSLMEVMIASVILLIASLGFTLGMISALKTQYMAGDHYRSMTIARNRIQRARSLNFDSLPLLSENDVRVDDLGYQSSTGYYYRSTVITNYATNCVELIVSVQFTKPGGELSALPVTLQTLIARGM